MTIFVLILGLPLLIPLVQPSVTPTQVPPGFVEIDGSKDPFAIPDYVAWRSFLLFIKDIPRDVAEWLPLTPEDKTLVLQAAAAQADRDNVCHKQMMAVFDQAKKDGASLLKAIEATHPLRIPCRQVDLDAADALMEKLTPEGRIDLQGSVDRFRTGLKSIIPKMDLPDFRKPR